VVCKGPPVPPPYDTAFVFFSSFPPPLVISIKRLLSQIRNRFSLLPVPFPFPRTPFRVSRCFHLSLFSGLLAPKRIFFPFETDRFMLISPAVANFLTFPALFSNCERVKLSLLMVLCAIFFLRMTNPPPTDQAFFEELVRPPPLHPILKTLDSQPASIPPKTHPHLFPRWKDEFIPNFFLPSLHAR